ncbi:unnamed protein product [Pleuronectes platessa]|uniref:Uncharacterized protein n=1 Tax=Pleuronectes platessa TaxID=8262 RepID=A0A9N7YLV7_PLEPL|nr:unnamed protein product [Pleuronectes platessa]
MEDKQSDEVGMRSKEGRKEGRREGSVMKNAGSRTDGENNLMTSRRVNLYIRSLNGDVKPPEVTESLDSVGSPVPVKSNNSVSNRLLALTRRAGLDGRPQRLREETKREQRGSSSLISSSLVFTLHPYECLQQRPQTSRPKTSLTTGRVQQVTPSASATVAHLPRGAPCLPSDLIPSTREVRLLHYKVNPPESREMWIHADFRETLG